MKILVIGGTQFLGRHIVQAALARGHELTLFHRGKTNPGLFAQVEEITGDRDQAADLALLEGREWDTVIDVCGYFPRQVRTLARQLAPSVDRYVFISSVSAYRDFKEPNQDENSPLGQLEDETTETMTTETYGPLKAVCEREVEAAMPGRVLIIRPGIICGPHDPTDRFTYWPHRVAQGGEMLAPGQPDHRLLYIDVRDLAAWTIRQVEARQTGVYNTYGPDYPLTMAEFLEECRRVTGSQTEFVWVEEAFLKQAGVLGKIPLWWPATEPALAGLSSIRSDKAIAAGLTYRPLAQTIQDTLSWEAARPADQTHWERVGLNLQNEQQILQQWKAQIG